MPKKQVHDNPGIAASFSTRSDHVWLKRISAQTRFRSSPRCFFTFGMFLRAPTKPTRNADYPKLLVREASKPPRARWSIAAVATDAARSNKDHSRSSTFALPLSSEFNSAFALVLAADVD